jgi:hypothetical protein
LDAVADPSHRDEPVGGDAELGAEPADVRIDRPREDLGVVPPDLGEERLSRPHAPLGPHEVLEQPELGHGEGHGLPLDERQVLLGRDLDRPGAQRRAPLLLPRLAALQEPARPEDQLPRREGLGHVVVGAQLEPQHPVDLLAPGGQQDDRRHPRLALAADLLEDVDAGQLGEHPVEHDQVEPLAPHRLERGEPIVRDPDLEPFLRQDVPQQLGDVDLIFDDQQALLHGVTVRVGRRRSVTAK